MKPARFNLKDIQDAFDEIESKLGGTINQVTKNTFNIGQIPPPPETASFPLPTGTLTADDALYLLKDPGNLSDSQSVGILEVDNQIRIATRYPGADASIKIANAIAALPASGGIVDARGFTGNQVMSISPFDELSTPDKQVTILFGPAHFRVQTTLTVRAAAGVKISGYGLPTFGGYVNAGTEFVWDGGNGGTVLLLDRVRDSIFENFSIIPGNTTIGIGIRLDHDEVPSGNYISAQDIIKNVSIMASTCGIQIGNDSVGNNSEHVIEDCTIADTGTYGIYINDAQSKYIRINRGTLANRTYAVYQNNGSFHATGVNLSLNTYDFSVNSVVDTILIQGCDSELSQRFLTTVGASLNPWCVTLIANRWSPANIDPTGQFIFFGKPGCLNLIGNDFADALNVSNASLSVQGTIAGAGRAVSIGNTYPSLSVFVNNPTAGNADIVSLGDMAFVSTGIAAQMPNILGTGYNGSLTLSNGANNDIATSGGDLTGSVNTSIAYRITGPTGAFSVSGFTGGCAGRTLELFNTTSQQMTIRNASGSSSANQILTLTGGDVTLRSGTSYASFRYDITLTKWILTSTNGLYGADGLGVGEV